MKKMNKIIKVYIVVFGVLSMLITVFSMDVLKAEETCKVEDGCSAQLRVYVDYQGGTYEGKKDYEFTGATGAKFQLYEPEKEGYIFCGWKITEGDCTICSSNGYQNVEITDQNCALKALWKNKEGIIVNDSENNLNFTNNNEIIDSDKILLRFDPDGGSYLGNVSNINRTVKFGDTSIIIPNVCFFVKEGYALKSIEANYGTCEITSDFKLKYTAPLDKKNDVIKLEWQPIAELEKSDRNNVRIRLNGGVETNTNEYCMVKQVALNDGLTINVSTNVKNDGHVMSGVHCDKSDVSVVENNGNIILQCNHFIPEGIDIELEWIPEQELVQKPMVTTTIVPMVTTTIVPSVAPVSTELPPVNVTAMTNVVAGSKQTTLPTEVPKVHLGNEEITEPVKITLGKNTYLLGQGEKVKIKASATRNAIIQYKSENTAVCTVSEKGIIKAVKPGMTQIVLSANGVKQKINVQVLLRPTKLCVTKDGDSKTTYKMQKGAKKQVKVYVYNNSHSYTIRYKSSNKKIATVNSSGLIKAKKKGTCRIVAKTYNNKKAVIVLVVKK